MMPGEQVVGVPVVVTEKAAIAQLARLKGGVLTSCRFGGGEFGPAEVRFAGFRGRMDPGTGVYVGALVLEMLPAGLRPDLMFGELDGLYEELTV